MKKLLQIITMALGVFMILKGTATATSAAAEGEASQLQISPANSSLSLEEQLSQWALLTANE